MTIHVSELRNNRRPNNKSNGISKQRKKSKPRILTGGSKFDKSVLEKRITNRNYNMNQDYSCFTKSGIKDKLKGSKSSGKISNVTMPSQSQQKPNKNRFSANTSTSKKRDKSFKKMKENEFRKLLRPVHTNSTIDNIFDDKLNNELKKQGLNGIQLGNSTSKSDHKLIKAKSRTSPNGAPTSLHIIRERCLNSIKCNLWTNDIGKSEISINHINEIFDNRNHLKYEMEGVPRKEKDIKLMTELNQDHFDKETRAMPITAKNKSLEALKSSETSSRRQSDSDNFDSDFSMSQDKTAPTPPQEKSINLKNSTKDDQIANVDQAETKEDTPNKKSLNDRPCNAFKISEELIPFEVNPTLLIKDEDDYVPDEIETSQRDIDLTINSNSPSVKDLPTLDDKKQIISKPPTGRYQKVKVNVWEKALNFSITDLEETPKEETTKKDKKDEFNFIDDDNCFDLLNDADNDFASSLSASSSQIDYDKMAMEAMEEVDEIVDTKVKVHPNNSLNTPYNYQSQRSKLTSDIFYTKTNNIDIIEEDVENEIDSEYSRTIKNVR